MAKAHFSTMSVFLHSVIVVHPRTKSLVQQGIAYKKFCTRFYNSFSPGLEVFIDMDMYMLTDGRNFKTFLLKRKLCNCMGQLRYLFAKI